MEVAGRGLSERGREELQFRSTENVLLSGYVSQDELVGLYQKANIYCPHSYRESFGLSLAEAMACGCVPVVTEGQCRSLWEVQAIMSHAEALSQLQRQ